MEEFPSVHSGKPKYFCLILPDIFNRELLPIAVLPDILYRESLWVFQDGYLPQARRYDGVMLSYPTFFIGNLSGVFQMDTCHRHAGMTKERWISADYLRG